MRHLKFSLITGFLLAAVSACYKPMDVTLTPPPPNTLILEFSTPVKFVMDLKIDGDEVPIKYGSKNRLLYIEGLSPGNHDYDVHSISYVFGPEFNKFTVSAEAGAYYFIQSRKYRSALPKNKAQTSIRAYRKKLKKEGVDMKTIHEGKIRATFYANKP